MSLAIGMGYGVRVLTTHLVASLRISDEDQHLYVEKSPQQHGQSSLNERRQISNQLLGM